jgi:membrane-associated phospholipid phosphatase
VEGQIGIEVVLWFQSWRSPWFGSLLLPLHWMGATAFYMALLSALYWCIDAKLGRRVTLVFLVAAWANGWLKALFDWPRPSEVSALVEPFVSAHGPGMPSGHTMTATVLWALIAIGLRRRAVTILAAAIIVLMGVSRLVHGVHFPSDVLVGWILGAVVVGAMVLVERPGESFLAKRTTLERFGLVVVATFCMLLVCPGVTSLGERSSYAPTVTSAGAFAGAALGMVIERARVRFVVASTVARRIWSFAVGGGSVVVVYGGLTIAAQRLATEPGWTEGVVRFVRYAIVGGWLAAGAPWLLVRAGLLGRAEADGAPSP